MVQLELRNHKFNHKHTNAIMNERILIDFMTEVAKENAVFIIKTMALEHVARRLGADTGKQYWHEQLAHKWANEIKSEDELRRLYNPSALRNLAEDAYAETIQGAQWVLLTFENLTRAEETFKENETTCISFVMGILEDAYNLALRLMRNRKN